MTRPSLVAYFHDECSFDLPRGSDPWGNRAVGKEQVRARDHGVSRWRLAGTTPKGERIEVHGCDLLDFKEGRITRKDSNGKLVEKR